LHSTKVQMTYLAVHTVHSFGASISLQRNWQSAMSSSQIASIVCGGIGYPQTDCKSTNNTLRRNWQSTNVQFCSLKIQQRRNRYSTASSTRSSACGGIGYPQLVRTDNVIKHQSIFIPTSPFSHVNTPTPTDNKPRSCL